MFIANRIGPFNYHCEVTGQQSAEFGEITRNNGHYDVQGHLRSPLLVPVEARMRLFY